MGLDGVEIVMECEDRFGIAIPDADAEALTTPRELTSYVLDRVASGPAGGCIRQRTFFRLRRGLRPAVGARASGIALDTRVRELLERRNWQASWEVIRAEAGEAHWPMVAPCAGWLEFRRLTLRGLVHELSLAHPRATRREGEPWTRELVSMEVRRVVDFVVGVRHFGEDDLFVADIGIQ